MDTGTMLSQLEQTTEIPDGSLHLVEMGDGSGTKTVTQETMVEETGKALKIGNLTELQTEEKTSIVAAINEAAQSGGGGTPVEVDVLDTQEEIEANTEAGKAAGALAVQEMFGALNDNLNGNILTYNESEDAFYIQHGADAVPKKLGNNNLLTTSCKYSYLSDADQYTAAYFVTGYDDLEINFVDSKNNTTVLGIYGQNTDPLESINGSLIKTVSKGNIVHADISGYDYVYYKFHSGGASYITCILTFS